MTMRPDFEQRLRAWLDEDGPHDVPARVVESAIEEAITTRRKRPLPSPLILARDAIDAATTRGSLPPRTVWLFAVVAFTLLALTIVLAGAFLFQVDRLRTNGPIAFDLDGDIYTYDPLRDERPEQLTRTLDIQEQGPIYSPDGRYLAYMTTEVASAELHVRDLETGRTIVLTDRDELILPLQAVPFGWSPDSTRLLAPARAASPDGTTVGIESVVIFDVTTREIELVPAGEPVWSFGWSPDGRHIGLVGQTGLSVFDVEQGEVRPIHTPDDGSATTAYWLSAAPPVFSSDGEAVLFTVEAGASTGGDIWRVALGTTSAEPVVTGVGNDVAPVTSRRGGGFIFGRSAAVTIQRALAEKDGSMPEDPERASDLLLVDRLGTAPRPVASGVWPRAAWSPDGRWLVTKSFDKELVLVDLERPDDPLRVKLPEQVGSFSWGPRPP